MVPTAASSSMPASAPTHTGARQTRGAQPTWQEPRRLASSTCIVNHGEVPAAIATAAANCSTSAAAAAAHRLEEDQPGVLLGAVHKVLRHMLPPRLVCWWQVHKAATLLGCERVL